MLKELREFAVKGNMVDMAVGIIIGSAFGTIVKSLVDDVIMPPIGLLLGKVDFANLYVNLSGQTYASLAAAREAGAPVIAYGAFLNTMLTFVIVAFAVFLLVKAINRLRTQEEEEPPDTKDCPYCKSSVRPEAIRCPECTSELEAAQAESE